MTQLDALSPRDLCSPEGACFYMNLEGFNMKVKDFGIKHRLLLHHTLVSMSFYKDSINNEFKQIWCCTCAPFTIFSTDRRKKKKKKRRNPSSSPDSTRSLIKDRLAAPRLAGRAPTDTDERFFVFELCARQNVQISPDDDKSGAVYWRKITAIRHFTVRAADGL